MIKDKDTWKKIPRHPGYWMSMEGEIRKMLTNGVRGGSGKKVFVRDDRVWLFFDGERWLRTVSELRRLTFGKDADKYSVNYKSGEGRIKLDKQRVVKLAKRFMPDVQIPVTPNGHGKFETSPSMKEKGMLACDTCGHIQAVELKKCKECENYITE